MAARTFISNYTVTLDAKGRVCIPASFRQILSAKETEGVYVCQSTAGGMLECFGDDVLETERAEVNQHKPFTKEYNKRAAQVLMRVASLPFDENGRIRLPDDCIKHAGLTDKAVIVGASDKFMIWSPERFQAFLADALKEEPEAQAEADGGAP